MGWHLEGLHREGGPELPTRYGMNINAIVLWIRLVYLCSNNPVRESNLAACCTIKD